MQLPLVLYFAAFVFAVQILLCFEAKKKWLRILPVTLATGFETLCWMVYFVGKLIREEETICFSAFVLGYIGLYWFLAPLVAWGVYVTRKICTKKKKIICDVKKKYLTSNRCCAIMPKVKENALTEEDPYGRIGNGAVAGLLRRHAY